MAVFRVEKNRNYTVMCNHHLKDKHLSLKAKGLLSVILSLPENWNYTTRGLSAICKEGVDSIGGTLRELEQEGYLVRNRLRDPKGRIKDTEYVIFEMPRKQDAVDTTEPCAEHLCTENSYMDVPCVDVADTESAVQFNTHKSNMHESKKQISNPNPSMIQRLKASQVEPTLNHEERMDAEEYQQTLLSVREQIDYDTLDTPYNHERLDEIAEIIAETLCSRRPYIKVAGENYPAEIVKSRFKKLNMYHIEYIFQSLDKKHTEVRNIRQYLMTTLYHAPTTMNNYYDAEVRSAGIL